MSVITYPSHPTPLSREAETDAALQRLMRKFPPGSLVTVQWLSTGPDYDGDEYGIEYESPEPALLIRHLPEHAFVSAPGWVLPFECMHRGELRVSTTYATKMLGKMPKTGERK